MHGRPRESQAQQKDPEKIAKAKQKATSFARLCKEVLERRDQRKYDDTSLGLAAKLLELNPEMYTVWNYRKEAISDVLSEGDEAAKVAGKVELDLTEKALKQNPKSYSTWHHRKWVVERKLTSLDWELQLVSKLLELDERNFHGWNYRRFVVELLGLTPEQELKYTEHKINQNFSNYSAWHYRTHLLPRVHATQPTLTLKELLAADENSPALPRPVLLPAWVLDEEYHLVQQALFTEPEDQSGWLYHRWLLGSSLLRMEAATGTSQEATAVEELTRTLTQEIQACRELLEVEPDAKWPLLTLARLLKALSSVQPSEQQSHAKEAEDMYHRLMQLDPMRKMYYTDELAGRANVVTQAAAYA